MRVSLFLCSLVGRVFSANCPIRAFSPFFYWGCGLFLLALQAFLVYFRSQFLVAQLVKNLPAVWETWVRSLGWEDPLEKGGAIHSNILAWRIPWTVESMGSQRVGHSE